MSEFFGGWMRGVVFVLIGIVGFGANIAACSAMIAAPYAAFAIPFEYIEPRWLGASIGIVSMLIVFGGICALIGDD